MASLSSVSAVGHYPPPPPSARDGGARCAHRDLDGAPRGRRGPRHAARARGGDGRRRGPRGRRCVPAGGYAPHAPRRAARRGMARNPAWHWGVTPPVWRRWARGAACGAWRGACRGRGFWLRVRAPWRAARRTRTGAANAPLGAEFCEMWVWGVRRGGWARGRGRTSPVRQPLCAGRPRRKKWRKRPRAPAARQTPHGA